MIPASVSSPRRAIHTNRSASSNHTPHHYPSSQQHNHNIPTGSASYNSTVPANTPITTAATAITSSSSIGNNTSMLSSSSSSLSSPHNNNSNLLSHFDFKAIDEMDPSLADGHRIYFEKEIPIELRAQDSTDNMDQDVGTLEGIRVKILTLGEDNKLLDVRVELTSESDLFFHYTHSCDKDAYVRMKQSQNLMVDFNGYPKVLSKMLISCVKDPESLLCIFVMGRDGNAQLTFVQNMEYKFVELLTLDFIESPEHVVRQHISFRYNSLRSRIAIMNARLQDVNALVKLKNPSLLLQLQRNSQQPQTNQGIANYPSRNASVYGQTQPPLSQSSTTSSKKHR